MGARMPWPTVGRPDERRATHTALETQFGVHRWHRVCVCPLGVNHPIGVAVVWVAEQEPPA